MPQSGLIAIGLRGSLGRWLWSGLSIFFPCLAVLEGEPYAVALLLYVIDASAALALLYVRLEVASRQARSDPKALERLRLTRQAMELAFGTMVLAVAWGGVVLLFAQTGTMAVVMERARPMLTGLLLAAVLDTLIAPVRSPEWLEAGLWWQATRGGVVVVSVPLIIPLALILRDYVLVGSFVLCRLVGEVRALIPGQRRRLLKGFLEAASGAAGQAAGRGLAPDTPGRELPQGPSNRRRAQRDDPRRLPD